MLPSKAFWVAVGLGDDGDEDEAFQFAFKADVVVFVGNESGHYSKIMILRSTFDKLGGQEGSLQIIGLKLRMKWSDSLFGS